MAFCRIRLFVIFGAQLLLATAAYIAITVMFVTVQQKQIDSDVELIVGKSLARASTFITAPMDKERFLSRFIANRIVSDPRVLRNVNLPMDNTSAHVTQWSLFRSAFEENPFLAYSYEDYNTEVPDAANPGAYLWVESTCSPVSCYLIDNTSTTRWVDIDAGRFLPDQLNTTVTQVYSQTPGTSNYIQFAKEARTDNGIWAVMYIWVDPSGIYFLQSYYRCLQWNSATGECRNSYGQDMDLGYIQKVISTFGATNVSKVSLVDLRGDMLMATNINIPFLNGSNAWPALSTPSPMINSVVVKFRSFCPLLQYCPPMIAVDAEWAVFDGVHYVVGALQISPYDGVNMLLMDLTPRSYYYDTVDKSRNVAIAVVVVVSVLSIVALALTYVGIQVPLTSLIENFQWASALKNELVVQTPSAITEVFALSEQFDAMNAKLLAARAFMPQSMLQEDNGVQSSGDDDEGDIEVSVARSNSERFTPKASKKSLNPHSSTRRMSVRRGVDAEGRDAASNSGSRPDARSAKATSRSSNGKRNGIDRFTSLIVEKQVSVVVVNLVGLHAYIKEQDNSAVEKLFKGWIGDVQATARAEKGVVDLCHGDRVVISFNASNNCSSHIRRATNCALTLMSYANTARMPPLASAGLSTGRARVGNVGTETLRSFTILGAVYTEAIYLERVACRLTTHEESTTCVAKSHEEVSFSAFTYPIGTCKRLGGIEAMLVAAPLQKSGDDEWLYELDSMKNNPFVPIAKAMTLIIKGNKTEAKALFEQKDKEEESETSKVDPEKPSPLLMSPTAGSPHLKAAVARGWAMVASSLSATGGAQDLVAW